MIAQTGPLFAKVPQGTAFGAPASTKCVACFAMTFETLEAGCQPVAALKNAAEGCMLFNVYGESIIGVSKLSQPNQSAERLPVIDYVIFANI